MDACRLVVLIPAYNEEQRITAVIRSVPARLAGCADIRVLVVDDGSTDGTVAAARAAGADVVSHGFNRGLGMAFRTGLARALELGADIMVNVDADGQFDPAEIPRLLAPILEGRADFVAADRFGEAKARPADMPWIKFWGNQQMTRLISLIAGRRFHDVSSGFRAYSREAMLWLNIHSVFTYTQESFLDLAAKGLRIEQVPVTVRYFPERRSKVAHSLFRYGKNTLLIIFRTVRDHKPLRTFGFLGSLLILAGLVLGGWLYAYFLKHGAFYPYTYIGVIATVLFMLGSIVWAIGLVADMLVPIRRNLELNLYLTKRRHYGDRARGH